MENSADSFRDYLQKEKNYSPHTVKGYLDDLLSFSDFLKREFSGCRPEEVSYGQIRNWIVLLVDSGLSNTSVNRRVASLKSFYKFLLKTKQISINPLQTHKALKTPKSLQIPFSEKELDQVLNALVFPEGFDGLRDKLIIDLFYSTGIRRSELINLKLSQVGATAMKVLGKRNKERIIPVLPVIASQFDVYLRERSSLPAIVDTDRFFVTSRGVKLNDSFVYRLINNYFSNVSEKVKKSPHILRHTFATHLLNNGADINSVKELLGHSSLASTQVYTHSSLAELKKVHGSAHPRSR